MKSSHFKSWRWLIVLLPIAACIKTEIIPEILEPQLLVSPATISLQVGATSPINASYFNAAGEDQSALLTWQSRNPAVAAVNTAGLVTGLAPGQTWAVVSAPDNRADSVLVTVVPDQNAVARIDILNAPATLEIGASTNLQAKAYNASGGELSSQAFTWMSSNGVILQLDAVGKATGLSAGTASVTASVGGINSLPAAIQVVAPGGSSRSGQFSGNSGYTVKGTATLEQSGNSLRLLLQSDFMASNGPMLGVYLATSASGGLSSQNSIKLGNLQANSGQQEYAVSAGVGLQDYNYVVIYCIPFNVRFGTAQLSN